MISAVIMLVEWTRNLINLANSYFSQIIYRETFTKIQSSLGNSMLSLENSCIDKNSSGLFIQRLTNDTSRIAEVFNTLNFSLTDIITNIGIFSAIFIINKYVFILLITEIIIIFLIERKKITLLNKKDKIYRKKMNKYLALLVN